MKRPKLVLFLFLVAFLIGVTPGISLEASAQKKLTVRGWAFRATKDIEPQVKEFQILFPDVKIEQINVANTDHHAKLMMEIISGTGAPDVAYDGNNYTMQYWKMGGLLPLTDVLPNWKEMFVPQSLVKWRHILDGELIAAPAYLGPFGIFWRKDIFDEVGISFPTSWQEYLEVGKKITIPGKRYMGLFTNVGALPAALVQARGGQVTDINNAVLFNNEITKEVIQYIAGCVVKYKIAEYAFHGDPETFQKMKEGGYVTIPIWHWYQTYGLKDQAYDPKLVGKWRFAKCLPWKTGDPPTGAAYTQGGDGVWEVLKQTKYPEVAKKFAAFLVTGSAQVDIAMRRGLFAYNRHALETLKNFADPFFGGQCHYKTGLEEILVTPPMKYGTKVEIIASALALATHKVIYEGVPVEKALSEAEEWAKKEIQK